MQSHQDSFGSNVLKSRGHRRSDTLGKSMPITSLLLNYTPSSLQQSENIRSDAGGRLSENDGSLSPTHWEKPPEFFPINDTPSKSEDVKNPQNCPDNDDDLDALEQDYEILISECSSSYASSNQQDDGDRRKANSDEYISLIGNSTFYTPCQTCVGSAPSDLAARPLAINEMCRRLCTDECRLRLSLAGLIPNSERTGENRKILEDYVQNTMLETPPMLPPRPLKKDEAPPLPQKDVVDQAPPRPSKKSQEILLSPQLPQRPKPATIAIQRKQFLKDILMQNSNYEELFSSDDDDDDDDNGNDNEGAAYKRRPPKDLLEIVANIVVPPPTPSVSPLPPSDNIKESPSNEKTNAETQRPIVDPHELAMLKDFREKFEIAEALAKTSAMTSTTQIKQRLAARKREIELDNANAISSADEHEHETAGKSDNTGFCGGTTTETGLMPPKNQQSHVKGTSAIDAVTKAETSVTSHQTENKPDIGSTVYQDDFEPPRELLLYLVR